MAAFHQQFGHLSAVALHHPALGRQLRPVTRAPDMTFRVFTDPDLDPLGRAVTTGV